MGLKSDFSLPQGDYVLGFVFFFLVFMPFIEIYFLFQMGGAIGFINTLLLVIAISIIGLSLARSQGQAVWLNFNMSLARGQMPQDSLFHGVMIFLGGVLLVIPGFVTDIIGLLLVVPGTRHFFVHNFKNSLKTKMARGQAQVFRFGQFGGGGFTYTQMRTDEFHREERDARVVDIIPERTEHSGPNENS